MAAEVLNHLDVDTGFHQPRSKGVTQGVATEIGQKNRVLLARVQLSPIAVPNDAPQSLVQCTLMLYSTKTVDKDKIIIAVNAGGAMGVGQPLIFLFHQKGFFYLRQHRNLARTRFGLGTVDIEGAACIFNLLPVVIVDQRMVNSNDFFFKINIFPYALKLNRYIPISATIFHQESVAQRLLNYVDSTILTLSQDQMPEASLEELLFRIAR